MTAVYRRQVEIFDRLDYVKGVGPLIVHDFRAERRMNRHQRGWNRKGLIAQDKVVKKDAFQMQADHCRRIAAWPET